MVFPRIEVLSGISYETWGRNARNNPFIVEIAGTVQGSWIGILSQEVYESHFKWKCLLVGTLLVRSLREEMELRGHAVEARVAADYEGLDYEEYLAAEASAIVLPNGSYVREGMFEGMTIGKAMDKMRERDSIARKWVANHSDFLSKWQARAPTAL
jgi:hypothetical protein